MKKHSGGRPGFPLAIVFAFAVGAFLRLYLLPSQILLDDEWHGLNQVIGKTFSGVLTTFDGKDNTSLPLNVYDWLLLHTTGWTEFAIRLPVLLAGLIGLVVMPLVLRRAATGRAAAIFAFLLAIAPFAIFYGRFSRAYVLTMLLAYLALMFAHRWLSSGGNTPAYSFLLTGTLAVYTHPLSVVAVAAPYAVYYTGALRRRRTAPRGEHAGRTPVGPGTVGRVGFIQLLTLVPLGWMMLSSASDLPWGEGSWTLRGVTDACMLLSGTANLPLNLLFYALLVRGLIVLFRRDSLLARICIVTFVLYIAALAVSRPFGLGTGVVILRYMIVMVPVALSIVALGIDSLPVPKRAADHPGIIAVPAAALLTAGLILAGPLPRIYDPPNNFTNHSAYQGTYEPPDPDSSDARHVYPGFSTTKNDVPDFYKTLRDRSDIDAVVEYPLDVTNYNNLLYFYQRVHRKRVIAGYITDGSLLGYRAEVPPGQEDIPLRMGVLSADQILSHAADPRALKFRNMVDVTDPAALSRSGAGVMIIHKYVMALRFLPGGHDAIPVRYRSAVGVARVCGRAFGPPIYEDDEIICFRIGKV